MDDNELIDEALKGNAAAFGQLVRKYQDRLYHVIAHVLGSNDEAYDVVQDAFVQAFVKLEGFTRSAAFYTWLYRIAINQALSRRRRKHATQSLEHLRAVAHHEPVDHGPAPDGPALQQERVERVRAALAALDEERRTVIVLREMNDLSYEAIAEILSLPVGTVRSRLHRAREELRELLKEETPQQSCTRPA